ncbi:hypothetical protein NAT47_05730, partial [Flavobacterium sp. HXWNR69]|nr:hypothetical protein [Flavobacterium sp. HXWNR69]
MKKLLILSFLLLSGLSNLFAQSSTCANAQAMCSGNQGPFNNTTSVPSFGNLGCLGSTPNPAWFYLQVGTSGNIDMTLSQIRNSNGNPIDVDFILWGPFNSLTNICNNLSLYSPGYSGPNNVVDCSYSASATETVNIPNAVVGQYYMLLVTNYSNQAGTYTLNQSGGAGALSCEIVCGVTLGPDRYLCGATTSVTLTATFLNPPTTPGSPVYSWYLNGVLQYTTTTNTTTVNQSGTWTVSVTRPGCSDVATDDIIVQFIGAVPFNSIGPFSGAAGECDPVFNLLSYQASLVAPFDPASFTFVYYDENGDIITDPANFSPADDTFIGINISAGPCSVFDIVEFYVDCVPATCDLDLTSAPATSSQNLCLNDPIVNITYQTSGDATNANVTGLPSGLSSSYTAGVLTISGNPTQTGTFNYTVETVGCTPNLTLTGSIVVNPNPTFTSLAANGPICIGQDAVFTLVGTPGAIVLYSIDGGSVQIANLDSSSGSATVTILAATSNVTINLIEIELGTCDIVLTNTATVVVQPTPAIPLITMTAPTCTADGFSTIINYDATLTYTFTPAGPTIDSTGLISGMTFGTSYTVTAGNGTCTSQASSSFSNTATLSIPLVPTISVTAPTCSANGFATITNYVTGLTYNFTPVGPTVDSTGLISGMTFGTSYVVSANNGSCSSTDSSSFVVNSILPTPVAPTVSVTAPTCAADGFSTITNYDATLTYTFTPAGPTINASGLVQGMVLGTSYQVTSTNASSCTSLVSNSFVNNPMLVTPAVPTISVTAPTCSANGFATITNYVTGLTYNFTPVGPTVDSTGLISGMTFGTSYVVSANNGSCSS